MRRAYAVGLELGAPCALVVLLAGIAAATAGPANDVKFRTALVNVSIVVATNGSTITSRLPVTLT